MRRAVPLLVVLACAVSACGERRPKPVTNGVGGIHPAAPPPPGSIAVVGPMAIEAIDVVRSEIGWDRDLVRATRLVDYDVVLKQDRATCPKDRVSTDKDFMGCSGVARIPADCTRETIRARLEVSVRWSIDVQQRCAGDASTYAVPASGDPKPALQTAGAACFRNKNKFKPESTWTSLYALTELSIDENIVETRTQAPLMLFLLLDGDTKQNMPQLGAPTATYCRDDGAFLDGTPGALLPKDLANPPAAKLVPLLMQRAPLTSEQDAIGLTSQGWRPEQAIWEECRAPEQRGNVVAQERCQLLRQLDRFLRDVEDAARPETPKGAASAAVSASASASTKKGAP